MDSWENIHHWADSEDADEVYIAGGFVRDSLLGKEIADIDMFISKKAIPDGLVETVWEPKGENYPDSQIEVYQFKGEGTPLQLIVVDGDVEEYIRKFPVSVSQCWIRLDDLDTVHTTEAFDESVETKTVSVYTGCESKYRQKIEDKFSDWEFDYPFPKTILRSLVSTPTGISF